VLKVKNHPDTQACNSQIIQHQAPLVIGNPVNYFRIHDDRIESDKVRNEQTDFLPLVENVERRLLPEGDFAQSKLHDQRILIWLLNYSMTKGVQDLDCAADNLKNFVFEQ
jgi:hypothetical protein